MMKLLDTVKAVFFANVVAAVADFLKFFKVFNKTLHHTNPRYIAYKDL